MEWNIDPVAFDFGFLQIRWYGICFMIGLLLGSTELPRALERRGQPREHGNALTVWVPIGMIIGAHLIHLIFYEPRSFIHNPRRIAEIGLGLASHGGGLGCIVATYFFTRKYKKDFHQYLDVVIAGAVWVIPAVRIGNFFNSEIYGRETSVRWGVIFKQHGFTVPRHPSQLYEAAIGFGLIGLVYYLEHGLKRKMRNGALFYSVAAAYFLTRFFVEWFKEYEAIPKEFPFTMGQLLSVPFILFFGYMALFSKKHNFLKPPDPVPVDGPKTTDDGGDEDAKEDTDDSKSDADKPGGLRA